jgi:transcriptional regulator with XRE-family HTH domain
LDGARLRFHDLRHTFASHLIIDLGLGISQQELANRMGTTASVISRIESGQHRTSAETLRRLADALEGSAVVGFDFGTRTKPEPELVTL